MRRLIISVALVLALGLPLTVFATSDTSNALYSGNITTSNLSTARTYARTVLTLDTADQLITPAYCNTNATDINISDGTTDVPFMPAAPSGNKMAIFVSSIGGNTSKNYKILTGGNTAMGGSEYIFPSTAGMLSNIGTTGLDTGDWVWEIKAFCDMSQMGKDIFLPFSGMKITVDDSTHGRITGNTNNTAFALTTGEHTLRVEVASGSTTIKVDGVTKASGLAAASVASYFTVGKDSTLPYIAYQKTWASGVLKQHISWQYLDALTDQSGNGNDPSFSFYSTVDSTLTSSLTSFGPKNTPATPTPAANSQGGLITTTVPEPANLYTELNMGFFGAGVITAFANISGTQDYIPLYVFGYAFGLAIVLGIMAFKLAEPKDRQGNTVGRGSLMAMGIVSGVVLAYFVYSSGGVLPGWVLIPSIMELLIGIVKRDPYVY